MTRIKVTAAELTRLIKTKVPDWFERAEELTSNIQNGAEKQFPPLWSEIKEVYITLQGGRVEGKCAYCEKWLEADKIEHDVEHFRPKARVSRWKSPKTLQAELDAASVKVVQPEDEDEPGYSLLAYQMFNYATVCKQCNSVLKKNLFPIKGKRRSDARDPAKLKAEGAFLIYPIGAVDDDPEDLIEFEGVSPQAKKAAGFGRVRALATIAIFELDDWRSRRSLLIDRAASIEKLWMALRLRDGGGSPVDVANAKKAIARLTAPTSRHANCLNSFKRLYDRNPAQARAVYEELLKKYLESNSPK